MPPTQVEDFALREPIGGRVINVQDIERSGATTMAELLRSLTEIQIQDQTGSPNVRIELRGMGAFSDPNTQVFVDGVRVREHEGLAFNWAAIPLASIERIEILPTGGSVMHGGGTAGGTIRIVTRTPPPTARSADLSATVGTHATHGLQAGLALGGGNTALRLTASRYDSDNTRENNRVRVDTAQSDLRWTSNTAAVALKFGADRQRIGLPGVLTAAQIAADPKVATTPSDFATQHGAFVTVSADRKIGSTQLSVNIDRRWRNTGAALRVGTPLRNDVDTSIALWTLAPRLRLTSLAGRYDDLTIGIDFEDSQFDARSQASIVNQPQSTQRSAAVYAQYSVRLPTRTELSIGARKQNVRYEATDTVGANANVNTRTNLHGWELSGRQTLAAGGFAYLKAGSTFRLPDVNGNYNPYTAQLTLLAPQTALHQEIGFGASSGTARYRVAVYRIALRNEISYDPLTLSNRNLLPTRRTGVELDVHAQAGPRLAIRTNYAYADATVSEGSIGGLSVAGRRLPLVPRHAFAAGLRYSWRPDADVSFDLRHTGNRLFDSIETNRTGAKMPAYTVADLRLNLRRDKWLLAGGARNLFNKKHLTYGLVTGMPTYVAFPAQEREVYVSARYDFR